MHLFHFYRLHSRPSETWYHIYHHPSCSLLIRFTTFGTFSRTRQWCLTDAFHRFFPIELLAKFLWYIRVTLIRGTTSANRSVVFRTRRESCLCCETDYNLDHTWPKLDEQTKSRWYSFAFWFMLSVVGVTQQCCWWNKRVAFCSCQVEKKFCSCSQKPTRMKPYVFQQTHAQW